MEVVAAVSADSCDDSDDEEEEGLSFFIPCAKPRRNLFPKSGTIWQSGNRCQNLARVSGHPCQIFFGNPEKKNWHGCPPDLATIWQRSGNKKMEKTHLAQFKKPPIVMEISGTAVM